MSPAHARGFTLVELVISIVVIGIALVGVLSVMNQTVLRSADPMLTEQAVAIAEAYLEEILGKEFSDPDGLPDAGRTTWDDVGDYNGLVEPPTDQNNSPLAALASYGVSVAVGAAAPVGGEILRLVTVTVTHPSGVNFTLAGYRGNW